MDHLEDESLHSMKGETINKDPVVQSRDYAQRWDTSCSSSKQYEDEYLPQHGIDVH